MSLYGTSVEYGIHCLLHLVQRTQDDPPSAKDVAEFQGISPTYVAKIFTQFQKAGILGSSEGVGGGFHLARSAGNITVLDIVDALEAHKPLFQCKEIRRNCTLYAGTPPKWATNDVCAVHAVMLAAEEKMREHLSNTTLASLSKRVDKKAPAEFGEATQSWFDERHNNRRARRRSRPDSVG